jgi:hypothetical protein
LAGIREAAMENAAAAQDGFRRFPRPGAVILRLAGRSANCCGLRASWSRRKWSPGG